MHPTDHTGEPPDRDRFAALLRDAIRQAGEQAEIHYDPEQFVLTAAGENRNQASLANVYREYCVSSPEQRRRLFRNVVRGWFAHLKSIPDEFEDAAHDLLPAVRTRAYIELNALRFRVQGATDFDWPYAPIGEHFALYLVYNLPESFMGIQRHHLDEWDVEFVPALERAMHNLAEMSNHQFDEIAPGVWRSPWSDNLDAARLVLIGLLRAHDIDGDPVVMVPNRDTLLLTGSENVDGLCVLAREAETAYAHARSVSGVALRLDGDDWVSFLPEPGHPAYHRFRQLRLNSLGSDYHEQKELLDQLHKQTDEDVYVAPLSGRSNPDTGEVRSYCVWTKDCHALLPVADNIVFVQLAGDQVGDVKVVDWDHAVEELGGLMEPTDYYPPRYRVRDFPAPEQLAALTSEE